MLSVLLLSRLMILLSILSVIRHLNWLLNLNLIYKTLWTGTGSGLLISMLKKLNWSNNTGAIDVKMDGSIFEEKSSLKMLGLTFSSR